MTLLRPTAGAGTEAGQVLVLTALAIALLLWVVLPVTSLALAAAERAAAQVATDAAALACADAGDIWTLVDARGVAYGARVTVSPTRGPAAARATWRADVAGWPLRALGWRVRVHAAVCTLRVRVRGAVPLWRLLGAERGPTWRLRAEARAMAPPAGLPGRDGAA